MYPRAPRAGAHKERAGRKSIHTRPPVNDPRIIAAKERGRACERTIEVIRTRPPKTERALPTRCSALLDIEEGPGLMIPMGKGIRGPAPVKRKLYLQ
jgi:hypothetical protein